MTTASPCRKICLYDAGAGWCRGCGRTLAEIAAWSDLSDVARAAVVVACARRLDNPEDDPPRPLS